MPAQTHPTLVVIAINLALGIAAFLFARRWWTASGRTMDRDATRLMIEILGGLTIFGMLMVFAM